MFGASPLGNRPLATAPRFPRPYLVAAIAGEYGFASWSYSRQGKLNAWGWSGIGQLGSILGWATLGNAVYMRDEVDSLVYVLKADTFLDAADANNESTSVEATTQWLDFGRVGRLKTLTGIDADCKNIALIEIYIAVDGDRNGELAETIQIGDNNSGWTYSGEVIPLNVASTEFKLRFVADPNAEAQVNRLTLHFEELQG